MRLNDYFENIKGKGILATADKNGMVNVAMYAKPHFMDEKTLCFVMGEKLSHEHLQLNPHAAYLFIEDGKGYTGKRLYLTKIREVKNSKLIELLMRERCHEPHEGYMDEDKYLVCFHIDQVLPLVGT